MKKIYTLIFVLSLMFSVSILAPIVVKGESENLEINNVSVENQAIIDDAQLEKIPSPDQIKNFKVIKKENGALYGVRLQNNRPETATNDSLERIPSPDQIRNFKVIKKENGVLYGIRLQNMGQTEKTEREEKNLEKISAPQFISQYTQIKQIGAALWGIKKEVKKDENMLPSHRLVSANMITCVESALDEKDDALKVLLSNSKIELEALITSRNTCQKMAISQEENQLENLNICVRNFQADYQKLIIKSKDSQQKLWRTYQASLKACDLDSQDDNNRLMIEDGGNILTEGIFAN